MNGVSRGNARTLVRHFGDVHEEGAKNRGEVEKEEIVADRKNRGTSLRSV